MSRLYIAACEEDNLRKTFIQLHHNFYGLKYFCLYKLQIILIWYKFTEQLFQCFLSSFIKLTEHFS